MKLNVYATPESIADKELKDKIVVVIDVLRATSTILAALVNGCREVIPAVEIEEVINMSKNYGRIPFSYVEKGILTPLKGSIFQLTFRIYC